MTGQEYYEQLVVEARGRPNRPRYYIGGPPAQRIRNMESSHEGRAREAGVVWDHVDIRAVYHQELGICGICKRPVPFETFTIDHRRPISRGGTHVRANVQLAHGACNSRKGNRWDGREP